MKLEIISPEKILFSGDVQKVTLPGTLGSFTILPNHAPIISSLGKGKIIYGKGIKEHNKEIELPINGGFIEMKNNTISVCLD